MRDVQRDRRACRRHGRDTPIKGLITSFVGTFIAFSILAKLVAMQNVNTAMEGAMIGVMAGAFDTAMHACHPLFGTLRVLLPAPRPVVVGRCRRPTSG